MKQENRFVAQLFHFLAPFVDMEKDLFICVDGGAATHHAQLESSVLQDPDVPDLWFSLVGRGRPVGIEAKVIENDSISVRQGQLQAWKTGGGGAYQPDFWVATNRDVSEFYAWHHDKLRARLDDTKSTVNNVKLSLANYEPDHQSNNLAQLGLFILTESNGH